MNSRLLYNSVIRLALLLALASLVLSGCQSGKQDDDADLYPEPGIVLPPPPDVEPLSQKDAENLGGELPLDESGSLRELDRPVELGEEAMVSELRTVYFAFDSAALTPDAMEILAGNAEWIKRHENATIQIEGHCDERGSTEYNINLGQRRADSVREYLVRLGVSPDRMTTISYGEERPVEPGHDESAWSQNRRAQFLVY